MFFHAHQPFSNLHLKDQQALIEAIKSFEIFNVLVLSTSLIFGLMKNLIFLFSLKEEDNSYRFYSFFLNYLNPLILNLLHQITYVNQKISSLTQFLSFTTSLASVPQTKNIESVSSQLAVQFALILSSFLLLCSFCLHPFSPQQLLFI